MKKTILIVNDDGIRAAGLVRLAEAAVAYGDVWVVAPETQQSGMSHRITSGRVEVYKHPFPVAGVKAFACTGAPADCVRVGVQVVGRKPDAVLSGINNGYNIAADIQYSGTAGAALEAAFLGIHAIAVSQDACEDHSVSDKYLSDLLGEYLEKPLGQQQIWNINFPNCPVDECRGVMRDCVVSRDDFYHDTFRKEDLGGRTGYTIEWGRDWHGTEGTDLYAIEHNYVSVGIVNNIR